MEAHGTGIQGAYDKAKQLLRLHTDRGSALREAILAVRKGGTLSILGVYGLMDKFSLGMLMNKGVTIRTALASAARLPAVQGQAGRLHSRRLRAASVVTWRTGRDGSDAFPG